MRFRIFFALSLLFAISAPLSAQQMPPGTTPPPETQPQTSAQDKAASALDEIEQKIEAKQYDSAEKSLGEFLHTHSSDARAWFDAGFVAQAKHKPLEAERHFRKAIECNHDQFEATLALGLLLAEQGQRAAANTLIERATQLTPASGDPAEKSRAWRALAQLDHRTLPATASNALLEALKLSPETTDDTLLAAEIAESANDFPAAEAAYRRILDKDKTNPEALSGVIHILLATQREPDAEALLKQALLTLPEDATLNTELATLLLRQGKDEEATTLLKHLHEINPQSDSISKMLADLLTGNNDAAGSEEVLEPLLEAHPKDYDLWLTHGHNLVLLKRNEEAVAAYRNATEIAPSNGDGWAGLAFAASEAHQPAVTLGALDNRDKFLPISASSLFLRATACDALHQTESAVAAYKSFLAASKGKFPNQEWQARQRISALTKPAQ